MPVTYIVNGVRVDPNGNPVQDQHPDVDATPIDPAAPSPTRTSWDDYKLAEMKELGTMAGVDMAGVTTRADAIERLEAAGFVEGVWQQTEGEGDPEGEQLPTPNDLTPNTENETPE